MIRSLLLLSSLAFLYSCSYPVRCDYATFGVDEFVMDSCQILQGKSSTLEMQDKLSEESCENHLMEEYEDTICEDDRLDILIHHPRRKDLTQAFNFINSSIGFKVTEGCIHLPGIKQPVELGGLTLTEARAKIQSIYQEEIQDIKVSVAYKQRARRNVEIIGGGGATIIPVDGKMRLYEILTHVRIPPHANLFMSYVSRDGQHLPVDFYKLIHQGDMSQNIVMRGGDRIFIAEVSNATVMVMGEVRWPRPIPMPYGHLSLREAIIGAGGISFKGDRYCIQVIRGGLLKPKIYLLSWETITYLPNEQLLLMPGDVVYVSEKPITQWNRFIEQVLPTVCGCNQCFETYQDVSVDVVDTP